MLLAEAIRDHAEDQALHFVGDFSEAIGDLESALKLIAGEPNADRLRFRLYKSLSTANIRYGNYGKARFYGQESLTLAREQEQCIDEIDACLGVGLASWFAGMYPDALEYTQAGLALAEEAGDRAGVGLLRANMCMIYRNAGDLEQALASGKGAIPILQDLGMKRLEGQARNRLGHTYLALERWQEADKMYTVALEVWKPLNNPNLYEAKAGRAVAVLERGRPMDAQQLVDDVLAFAVDDALQRVVEPVLMLLNCETVLAANGQMERAASVLSQAQQWVGKIALRNEEEAVRRAYLENVPAHMELSARLVGSRQY